MSEDFSRIASVFGRIARQNIDIIISICADPEDLRISDLKTNRYLALVLLTK